jgi:hypothetical protein
VQTITAVGVVPTDRITISMDADNEANDNTSETLDVNSMNAIAGVDKITVTIVFERPALGNINLLWSK